jgi:hypothetical protein
MSTSNTEKPTAQIATMAGREGAQFYKSYRTLKGLVRQGVEHDDVLGFGDSLGLDRDALTERDPDSEGVPSTDDEGEAIGPPDPEEYADLAAAGRLRRFMEWFRSAQTALVARPVGVAALRAGEHYTAKWIDSAAARGYRSAGYALRRSGVPVTVSVEIAGIDPESIYAAESRRRYAALRSTQFGQLSGLSDDVASDVYATIRGEYGAGGRTPARVARSINQRVDAVGITRARTIAQTELSRVYNAAAAERYRQNGVRYVDVSNPSPCPKICAPAIAANPYRVERVSGLMPLHPNCLCFIIPRRAPTRTGAFRSVLPRLTA